MEAALLMLTGVCLWAVLGDSLLIWWFGPRYNTWKFRNREYKAVLAALAWPVTFCIWSDV